MSAAWAQYHKWRRVLTNNAISIKLRLKLFSATVTPCALFGIGALSLTATHREALDRIQRKMIRNIVGWVRLPDDTWKDTMSRMAVRVQRACRYWLVPAWSVLAIQRKWDWACRIHSMDMSRWPKILAGWDIKSCHPGATRGRGRPKTRWHDDLNAFCLMLGLSGWHSLEYTGQQYLDSLRADYIRFVQNDSFDDSFQVNP